MPAEPPLPETERGDILVVDDTPENITVLRDILVRAGHRVRPALDGALALRAIEARCPDLVLLDIMMPGLDGHETCARIHALPTAHDLPVIFISALDGAADKLRAFHEGGVDYVSKPFHPAEVLARVQVHLRLRAARRRLARQNHELEAAARLRDDVDAILRHDLKSPLATILAAAESLADAAPSPPPAALVATLTGHIRDAGWSMLEQIHGSLDLLRMERGVYPLRPHAFDLRDTLARLASELAPTPAGRRAAIRIEETDTPGAPWWTEAEPMLCRGLFRNLLKNALEASPDEPGATVRVTREPVPADTDALTVVITNRGEVPTEIRARLFQKFATAGKDGGTGLGAYSARLMAETQRGSVRLAPAPPGHTAIAVTLPLAHPAAPAANSATSPVVPAGLRVLIADDDRAHADAIARLLAGAGVETVLAIDGEAALARLAHGDCSAALVDYEMPGANGPLVARRHRAAGGRTRLLALTSHDDPARHAECLAAGFDRVLVKPVPKSRLLAELADAPAPPARETAGPVEPLDPDLLPLLPAFLEQRATELAALESTLARGDIAGVRALSHRLRGGFSIYGFTAAANACAALEHASAASDAGAAALHLATLTGTLERLRLHAAAAP